jgi:hypothetical protein
MQSRWCVVPCVHHPILANTSYDHGTIMPLTSCIKICRCHCCSQVATTNPGWTAEALSHTELSAQPLCHGDLRAFYNTRCVRLC